MQPVLRRVNIAAVVLVALMGDWIGRQFPGGATAVAFDYEVFWRAANSLHPYAEGPRSIPYPPTALIWLRPLAQVDFWTGYAIWVGLSLTLFAVAAWRLFPARVVLFSLVSPIVVRCAILGQTPLLLTAALFLGFSGGSIATGIAIGLVGSIKPQLVFLAPIVLVARRDWRAIVAAAAALALSVIVELACFGLAIWPDWIAMLPRFHQTLVDEQVFGSCISFGGLAEGNGLPFLPIFLATLLVASYLAYRLAPRLEGGQLLGLMVACSAVAAPYSLPHDVVALVPLAGLIILGKPRLASFPAVMFFTWASPFLATLTSIALAFRSLGARQPTISA